MLSFPFFIWRISLATICCAFAPYLRVLPEAERRERVVEVRRVPAVATARRVRERVVAALVPRAELVRRRAGELVDVRAGRELELRLLVAMGLASCGVRSSSRQGSPELQLSNLPKTKVRCQHRSYGEQQGACRHGNLFRQQRNHQGRCEKARS